MNILQIPQQMICPGTGFIMREPITLSDGLTYEKDHGNYIINNNDTQKSKLLSDNIIENNILKVQIENYLNQNPDLIYFDVIYIPQSFKKEMLKHITNKNSKLIKYMLKKDIRLLYHELEDKKTFLDYIIDPDKILLGKVFIDNFTILINELKKVKQQPEIHFDEQQKEENARLKMWIGEIQEECQKEYQENEDLKFDIKVLQQLYDQQYYEKQILIDQLKQLSLQNKDQNSDILLDQIVQNNQNEKNQQNILINKLHTQLAQLQNQNDILTKHNQDLQIIQHIFDKNISKRLKQDNLNTYDNQIKMQDELIQAQQEIIKLKQFIGTQQKKLENYYQQIELIKELNELKLQSQIEQLQNNNSFAKQNIQLVDAIQEINIIQSKQSSNIMDNFEQQEQKISQKNEYNQTQKEKVKDMEVHKDDQNLLEEQKLINEKTEIYLDDFKKSHKEFINDMNEEQRDIKNHLEEFQQEKKRQMKIEQQIYEHNQQVEKQRQIRAQKLLQDNTIQIVKEAQEQILAVQLKMNSMNVSKQIELQQEQFQNDLDLSLKRNSLQDINIHTSNFTLKQLNKDKLKIDNHNVTFKSSLSNLAKKFNKSHELKQSKHLQDQNQLEQKFEKMQEESQRQKHIQINPNQKLDIKQPKLISVIELDGQLMDESLKPFENQINKQNMSKIKAEFEEELKKKNQQYNYEAQLYDQLDQENKDGFYQQKKFNDDYCKIQ